MKPSLIATIAVGIVIAIVTAGFSYQPAYNQKCIEEGGKITGFLKCTIIWEDFDQDPNKFAEKPEILKFDYAHKISEPIKFSVKKSGFGCGFTIMARVFDKETSEQVWLEQADRICPSFVKDEEYSLVIDFPQNNYPDLVINKIGDYMLEIESEGVFIEYEFIVRENASGGSIDKTAYPITEPDAEPKPMKLSELGKLTTISEYNIKTSVGNVSLPTYLPPEIRIESERLQGDITTFFCLPNSIQSSDNLTLAQIQKQGLIIQITRNYDNNDWKKTVEFLVEEAPEVRSKSTFKDLDILLVHSTEFNEYHAITSVDNIKIEIFSEKFDDLQLEKVLKSMFNV